MIRKRFSWPDRFPGGWVALLAAATLALAVSWFPSERADSAGSGDVAGAGVTLRVAEHSELGAIVTDGNGRVVYVFLRDRPDAPSTCEGPCADRWPPVLVEEDGTPRGVGIGGELGSSVRSDGRVQVTLNGMPLYYWYEDEVPGDAKGQGVGGVWFVVPADPAAAAPARVEVARRPDLGEYLVDAYGRALYMFERDDGGVSSCYDGCAQNWPPVEAEALRAAAVSATLGTTERRDGGEQLTVAGMPVYYFAGDRHPGQLNGQGFRDVWYVLAPDGEVIRAAVQPTAEAEEARAVQPETSDPAPVVEIAIRGFAYQPPAVTVRAGTTVVWTNGDAAPHTVTGFETPRMLDSPLLHTGGQFRFTFPEAGRYRYFCAVHPDMIGEVIVEDDGA